MTGRVLPRDEYGRLADTALGPVVAAIPASACVLVVENGDQVVATWMLAPYWHAEGLWIAEAARGNPGVARRLLRMAAQLGASLGLRDVVTGALPGPEGDLVRRLLAHVGAVELAPQYVLPIHRPKGDVCRSQA